MPLRAAILVSSLLFALHLGAQTRLDTTHVGNPDTILIRRYAAGDTLLYETFKLNGNLVKTRQYYYTDTTFGYTEMGIQFWTSRWLEFYRDSTRRIAATFVDEKLDGRYQKFYPDGKLWCDYTYTKGKRSGVQKEYYPNGQPSYVYNCVDDVENGAFVRYEETGTVRVTGKQVGKAYTDTVTFYHANGKLSRAMVYDYGAPMEALSSYDANGKVRETGSLKEGFGTLYLYSEEGKLECIKYYWRGMVRYTQWVE